MWKTFYESYKSLVNIATCANDLDVLSIQILNTINEIKEIENEYCKYEPLIQEKQKPILNSSFNELKQLLWTRFCNQMRDYSDTLYRLLNKNVSYKNKKK